MIIDAHAWIGHWPFRPLPHRGVADLLRQMDRCGIAKALVGSLHGLFYQDCHEANRELQKETRRHRDRLMPCAIINPRYPGWREDLAECREKFGMRCVRIVPQYHAYA